jgi:hypothetical protein
VAAAAKATARFQQVARQQDAQAAPIVRQVVHAVPANIVLTEQQLAGQASEKGGPMSAEDWRLALAEISQSVKANGVTLAEIAAHHRSLPGTSYPATRY